MKNAIYGLVLNGFFLSSQSLLYQIFQFDRVHRKFANALAQLVCGHLVFIMQPSELTLGQVELFVRAFGSFKYFFLIFVIFKSIKFNFQLENKRISTCFGRQVHFWFFWNLGQFFEELWTILTKLKRNKSAFSLKVSWLVRNRPKQLRSILDLNKDKYRIALIYLPQAKSHSRLWHQIIL